MSYQRQQILSGVGMLLCEDELLRSMVDRDFMTSARDPVLLYSIASHADAAAILRANEEAARESYLMSADCYGLVLGDFLPAPFKNALTATVAMQKYRAGTHVTAADDWDAFLSLSRSRVDGLPTGLPALDKMLGGGLSGLTLLGANEGDGKSSLILSMFISALRADKDLDCLLLSLDQSKMTTLARLHCLVTECDRWTLQLPPEQRPGEVNRRIQEGEAVLREDLLPRMRVVEKRNLRADVELSADTFLGYYQELNRKTKATRGILGIDMFQSLDLFPEGVVTDNDKDDYRLEVIRYFMDRTRSHSCPDGLPVVATSEVRKIDRAELTSNDLRGSARLGSLAINILLVWAPEGTDQYADVVPRVLKVAKTRPGNKGILQIEFHHAICRFTEVAVADRSTVRTVRSRRLSGGKAL
jgi:hypothetical protein